MSAFYRKVQWWLQRRRKEDELREELAFHLAEEASERQGEGSPEHEAQWAARRDLGNTTLLRENVRAMWSWGLLEQIVQDVRHAMRTLRRSLGFTVTAVLTLALGIGANTAMFSLLDAVLLRALPFHESHRLVEIWGRDAQRTGMRVPGVLVEALRERSTTLAQIAIHSPEGGELRTAEGPVRIIGRRVSANYFDVLGVPPLEGRTLQPHDEDAASPAVMVVSYGFWQQRMGGKPEEAVGRTVYIGAVPYTVAGIMPADFRTSYRLRNEDFWTPHVREPIRQLEEKSGYELVGRLAPGVRLEDARRELQTIAATISVEAWGPGERRLDLVPVLADIVGDSATVLQLVTAATAVFLVMICANVALLSLARSDRRFAEFATRKALGATGSRLVRLALVESLLLAAVGGLAGVALSYWLMPALRAWAPSEIPRLAEAAIDRRVLAVAITLSTVTGIVVGLMPAVRLSRISVIDAIKRGVGAFPRHRARFQAGLVVAQIAATVALLVMAGLIGRTFLNLLPSQPGFEPHFRSVFGFILPPAAAADRIKSLEHLTQRLQALPGVEGAALGSNVPFVHDDGFRRVYSLAGSAEADEVRADVRVVSDDYFRVLDMRVTSGRSFSSRDRATAPGAAIVNETMARRLGGEVLGRRLRVESGTASLAAYEIVGVVANARSSGATTGIWDEVYIPLAQSNPSILWVVLWSRLDLTTLEAAVRRELRAALPDRVDDPVDRLVPVSALMSSVLARPRFGATLFGAFAATALLLATIGVSSLIAYAVAQRRAELGLRAALGADSRRLVRLVLNSITRLVAVGIGLGLIVALYATRWVASQLYGVERLDVPTFLGSAIAMAVVALVAAYVPARRAARVDPMVALRCE